MYDYISIFLELNISFLDNCVLQIYNCDVLIFSSLAYNQFNHARLTFDLPLTVSCTFRREKILCYYTMYSVEKSQYFLVRSPYYWSGCRVSWTYTM